MTARNVKNIKNPLESLLPHFHDSAGGFLDVAPLKHLCQGFYMRGNETILKGALASSSAAATPTVPMEIHFIKSSHFRVIHANGVWYGGDSQKNLHLTVFNERTAIPKKVVVNLNEDGLVVGEDLEKRVSKEGIIREMEVDIVFSIPAAIEFHRSLGENLKNLTAIENDEHSQ